VVGNPGLQIAQARVRQAQARARSTQTDLLPRIDGKASFQRTHYTGQGLIPPPLAGSEAWDNSVLLQAGYDLDLWGKNSKRFETALDAVRAAESRTRAAQLSLQTAVVRAYLSLTLDYALLDVARSTVAEQQEILDITRRRLDAGLGTQLEVAEAEAPLPVSRAQIEALREQIMQTRYQLAALTGAGPGAGERLARPALVLAQDVPLPAAIPAHLLGSRPDVVAARWQAQAAASEVKVAKAEFYPDINLTAVAGFASLNFSQLFTADALSAAAGPAISLPIFNGGRLRAGLDASTAAYDAAVESYNSTLIQALQEVADRITAVRSLDVQLRESGTSVRAARKAYDLALGGYRAGLVEYLTVLNTQAHLLQAQRALAQLQARRLDAYASLVESLGGSTDDPMQPVPQPTAAVSARTP
jgi:NodT family efflux transporter outer membrane factor (OMF) lipoprotein